MTYTVKYVAPGSRKPREKGSAWGTELVQACDYRGEMLQGADKTNCGCLRTWHCGAGRGSFKSNPFEVALGECLRCVKGQT